jgi:glycosyltransferase involved in cell wall biosynthesis
MLPATRLLIQVVPRLTPGRCGVSDQAALLARELKRKFAIDSAFVILNSKEGCDLSYPVVYCPPSQLLENCLRLTEGRSGALLVHLSGYGYSADGAPTLLADALRGVRASGRFRIAVYFHELFVGGMPWRKAFWFSRRQRRAVRRIVEEADLEVTSMRRHADWLECEPMRLCKTPVQLLPVFSSAGETDEPAPPGSRDAALAVFGLPGSRRKSYNRLPSMGSMLRSLGIKEIIDVGPEFDIPSAVLELPVRRMGEQPEEGLADLFSRTAFGFVPHAPEGLAKSSIFASYCAHGMIPVLAESFSMEVDGLKDGIHVVSPQSVQTALESGLDSCSTAAWHWYSGHRLRAHAALYSRWLDQRSAAPADVEASGARGENSTERKLLTSAVCIGTFNQGHYLRECIESVLAQTNPVQEVWVSDDASTDNTPGLMEEICRLYPRVHYYRQPTNLGIAGNLSWVLSQPSTELIARIDSDDKLEPGFIATLADLLSIHPQAGFAHADVYELDSEGIQKRIRRLHRSRIYEGPEEWLRKSARGYRVAANCILYRAAALKQANYFRANAAWKSAEDWDLSVRIAILGWGNVYAAAPLASYRIWNDSGQARFKRRLSEIECVTKVYKGTLEPEYIRRGWNTRILRKNMRSRALCFSDALDSPLFSETERKIYKSRLRELGDSPSLSMAILLAEAGLNPALRSLRQVKIRLKDLVKSCLRSVQSQANHGKRQ